MRLARMMGPRRRPVVAVVSFTDADLCAARQAACLARQLDVRLTVAVLRPTTVWLGAAGPLTLPTFADDYDLQLTTALVRALDPIGIPWRLVVLDSFVHSTRLIRELDAGMVIVGAPYGWGNPVGRIRQLWRANRLSRRSSIPVGVWSARRGLSSRG
ncbi:hypothetical protein Asp14428_76410 [Actinoplanes sp. NBRC 14428]|nr:hypothetical protein Asp14428_76410 [Actinoplanes sp. NBRC 14428]